MRNTGWMLVVFGAMIAVGIAGAGPAQADEADVFFDDSFVHEIHITFDDADWYDTLYDSHANDPDDPFFPAAIECDGVAIDPVGVRFKGNSSFSIPGVKKSFKIDFNEYDDETTFVGLKKLNLNNGFKDPTHLRAKLFLDFAGAYVPTIRAVHTRVYVNGTYWGLYTAVEQVDKTFAESRFGGAEASEWMNNSHYTELLLDHSADIIKELDSWGFFDSAAYAKSLRRPLEERKIPLYERVMLTHLVKEDGRIAGAMGLFIDKNQSLVIRAKSVILCTGASGFKPAGWQIGSLTSDGDAMAYRIGAEITGKEWCDGHSRTNPGLEGMNRVVSQANLMPMLGVEQNVEVSQNGPMDSMGPPPGGRSDDGPAGAHRGGPPPGGRPSGGGPPGGPPPGGGDPPVMMGGASAGMSIHKAEGLFPADGECASNIPGLYAAGDSLGSMQTGGIYTQVGSSLAGSAVQGAIAGKVAARFAANALLPGVSESALKKLNSEIYAPLLRERGFSPRWVTQTLQGIMIPNFILYVKSEERLQAALTYVEYLRDRQVPMLMADDEHELRQAHETANMVLNAEMKLRASLMRTESRGSHYREDYPDRNDDEWVAWIKIRQDDEGSMELVKHPIRRS